MLPIYMQSPKAHATSSPTYSDTKADRAEPTMPMKNNFRKDLLSITRDIGINTTNSAKASMIAIANNDEIENSGPATKKDQ